MTRNWKIGAATAAAIAAGALLAGVFLPFGASRRTFAVDLQSHRTTVQKNAPDGYDTVTGTVVVRLNLPFHQKALAKYIIPVDRDRRPLPGAADLVFYAPFSMEAWRKPPNRPFHRRFAEEFGCTIFSFAIDGVKIDPDSPDYYASPASGWYEAVFAFQEWLERQYRLPHRKLLIAGISSGGGMAQGMAAARPDRVAAAAWIGGARYRPVSPESRVAWLGISVFGCPGLAATRRLAAAVNSAGKPWVLHGESAPDPAELGTANFHHSGDARCERLVQTFLRDMCRLRDANRGEIPSPDVWPSVRTMPDGRILRLPSEEFAAQWMQLPHRQSRHFRDAGRDRNRLLVFTPETRDADRIVLYLHDPAVCTTTSLPDNLHFLTERGARVYSVEATDHPRQLAETLRRALPAILDDPAGQSLPVYVVGSGLGGAVAAGVALRNGSGRIRRITLFNAPDAHPFPEFSLERAANPGRIPCRLIRSGRSFSSAAVPPEGAVVETRNLPAHFGKQWFPLLEAACRD